LKLPKARKAESTTIVDSEGGYVDDQRSCVDCRKGDSTIVIDHEEALRGKSSTDRKDCGTRTCAKDNISRAGHNWNHGIRKGIFFSARRIVG